MKNFQSCLLAVCLLLTGPVSWSSAVLAADVNEQQSLSDEVKELTAAINRLTEIHEQHEKQAEQEALSRKLDTAIAYLNFRSRRIELLEQNLQQLRAGRDRLAATIVQLDERGNLIETQARTSTFGSPIELDKLRQENQLRSKMMQERIERADQEIVILENKIQELQTEISSVESFVQKNLQF